MLFTVCRALLRIRIRRARIPGKLAGWQDKSSAVNGNGKGERDLWKQEKLIWKTGLTPCRKQE